MIAALLILAATCLVLPFGAGLITFLEYLKVGVPLTVLSLLFGAFFLGRG